MSALSAVLMDSRHFMRIDLPGITTTPVSCPRLQSEPEKYGGASRPPPAHVPRLDFGGANKKSERRRPSAFFGLK